MSYDLLFYFPIAPSEMPAPRRGGITVDGPYAIDSEDIDESYRPVVAACRYCVTICCTGSQENFDDLDRMKNEILARNSGVVLVDTQIGIAVVQGKEIAYAARAKRKESYASISIYFEDGQRFETQLFDQFLDLLQRHIPKSMPRRYGPEEPLKYKLQDHGLDHFRAEWQKNPALCWQSSPPFEWVFTFIPNDRRDFATPHGPHSPFLRHYRCSLISLRVRSQLYRDAGLLKCARDFVADAAILTRAFYSEIRIGDPQTGWWWQGIPAGKPLVVIVGPPYLSLWEEFAAISQPLGNEHRLASRSIDATTDEITIPDHLADPKDMTRFMPPGAREYAPVFPFNRPPPRARTSDGRSN